MPGKRIAICYDFDKTLAPDDMQSFTFIPSVGMEIDEFWRECNQLARGNGMERNLAWMLQMIEKATQQGYAIHRDAFRALGEHVKLYEGVTQWFALVNEYAVQKGVEVEHYIISSGLKEIIEGSSIAHYFKRIYASSFYYDEGGSARWPAQAVNYTNKTQYIFRIAKGAFDENDDTVNETVTDAHLYVPYDNMVYIGDSETDIPCMRLVKSKGGVSIGVFDPQKDNRRRVYELFNDGRINYFAPADYREGGQLYAIMQKIIDHVAAREALKEISAVQQESAKRYAMYKSVESALGASDGEDSAALLSVLRRQVDGNID